MSIFNAEQFLDMEIEGSNDTVAIPVPVGDYVAVVTDAKTRQWSSKDGLKSGIALDLIWEIDDAEVKELLGRDKVTCKQGIMLDLTESGSIDMGRGKNLGLGRLREALGLNDPSRSFTFSMLPGRTGRVKVSHRISGEDVFAEIKHVTAI